MEDQFSKYIEKIELKIQGYYSILINATNMII